MDFERIYPCRLWASWEARYHELRGAIDAYNAGKLIKVPKYLEKVLKRHLGPSLMGRNSKISRIVRLVDMTKANTDDDTGTNKSDDDIEVLAAVPKRSYWKKHHRTPVSINSQYDPIVIDFSDTETQHTSSFNGEGNNVSGATTSNDKKKITITTPIITAALMILIAALVVTLAAKLEALITPGASLFQQH